MASHTRKSFSPDVTMGMMGKGRGRHLLEEAWKSLPHAPGGRTRSLSGASDVGQSRSRSLSGTSDRSTSSIGDVEECEYCSRGAQRIFCRTCGYSFQGRVRGQCEQHPEVIFLMDFECCPQENCRSHSLREFSPAMSRGGATSPSNVTLRSGMTSPTGRVSPVMRANSPLCTSPNNATLRSGITSPTGRVSPVMRANSPLCSSPAPDDNNNRSVGRGQVLGEKILRLSPQLLSSDGQQSPWGKPEREAPPFLANRHF